MKILKTTILTPAGPAGWATMALAAVLWTRSASAAVPIYVSFQEGDVRVGGGREAVTTNGTLVTASYNMGGTYVRSDQPTSNKDGTNLIAGTQSSGNKMRPLLSFDLSHLTNVVGTDFSRIDSAALILTHESIAGQGGAATYAVHWTRSFNETSATWNNPHGDAANAGGFVGTELRALSCTSAALAPARETWASPGWFWAEVGSGPDLLVQAVRDALTNSTKRLNLLVKRVAETNSDSFSRFKHDNDSVVSYRPELLVGIDSLSNPPVLLNVTATDPTASESGPTSALFTLIRTGNTNDAVTVGFSFSGSATPGVDYTVTPSNSVSFAPGVTNATVVLMPVNDSMEEADETAVLTLQSHTDYVAVNSSATVTIVDDDTPRPLATYFFNENDNTAPWLGTVAAATVPDAARVAASNAAAGAGLGQFGPGGDAANGHGYGTGAFVSAPSGFYARCSGTASNLADALAADDCVSFSVGPQLGYAVNLTALSAWVKLQAPTNLTATVVVRSSQDGFSNDLASLTIVGNTTNAGFTLLTNTLDGPAFTATFQPVEFRFYLFDDSDSGSEHLRLDDVMFFGTATNLPAGVQIVTLTASDPAATESGGDSGAFTLQRIGDTSGSLSVAWTLSGTASNGIDYAWLGGGTNFSPGASNVVISLIPLNDVKADPDETVTLTLTPSAGPVFIGPTTATVTIADDNDPPEFVVAATTPLAYEPLPAPGGVFTISRSLGDTNAAVMVQLAFSGTASEGDDYTADVAPTFQSADAPATRKSSAAEDNSQVGKPAIRQTGKSALQGGSISFEPGVLSRTVVITPVNDTEFEAPETVTLSLLPGSGYSLGAADSASVTIFDDEGAPNASLLLEAESFADLGGWVVDQQFVDLMGSPYLLAHGKGCPGPEARTTAQFAATGAYRLWVRTKDWTAPQPDHPGRFKVVVGGMEAAATFGTVGAGWLWQDGGLVMITNAATEIRLRDLTGFDGRCDALFFSTDPTFVPSNSLPELTAWRRTQLGLPAVPPSAGEFDLVVVGGGISGSAAAIAAARQGLQAALIHDRPVPGGNASQDIRVHTLGDNPGGIVDEINTPDYLIGSDQFIQSDQRRMQVLQAETNLHLFTEWRAFAVQTSGAHLTSVDAKHIRTGEERRFHAPLFIDSTGDGWIGFWAGAQWRQGREARAEFGESLAPVAPDAMTMGNTLSWNSRNAGRAVAFPTVPWTTNVARDYSATRGDWWWEYGLWRDTVYDAEEIRDYLLQAIYGSFANAKKSPANANLELDWVAYVAGKRESRRLLGDHILTEADVRNHPAWPDAVVVESRAIDIHFPIGNDYDWQTYAQFTGIAPYWIPFRCLYSTNLDNLMMAGRCFSASHVGLGSPRVMHTGGQMGVAVGAAAALCKKHGATPRGVAQRLTAGLQQLINATSYSDAPSNTVALVDNADSARVELTGAWTSSRSQAGYFDTDYLLDGNTNKGLKSVRFRPDVPLRGNYRVYLRWAAASGRASTVPVDVIGSRGTNTVLVNQTLAAGAWQLLGTFAFDVGNAGGILIRTTNTVGQVVADAVALAADFPLDAAFSGLPWQDNDGDSVCNYAEFLNGTNPGDPASFVKADFALQNGAATLRFVVLAGNSYTVQYRDSLSDGPWQKLTDVPAGGFTREVEVPDPQPATSGARFYRLVTPALP
ncbi:MAG: FAD-dependent oxidoreductase [Verrucomicrobia bacterium]|nr:FAD-dependent oxidoreductase [Verrucomicrobiota bacterium]